MNAEIVARLEQSFADDKFMPEMAKSEVAHAGMSAGVTLMSALIGLAVNRAFDVAREGGTPADVYRELQNNLQVEEGDKQELVFSLLKKTD